MEEEAGGSVQGAGVRATGLAQVSLQAVHELRELASLQDEAAGDGGPLRCARGGAAQRVRGWLAASSDVVPLSERLPVFPCSR